MGQSPAVNAAPLRRRYTLTTRSGDREAFPRTAHRQKQIRMDIPGLLIVVFTASLIVSVLGQGGTLTSERLLCAPRPVAALHNLHYDKFSGDWKEIMKSPGAPDVVPFRAGLWRIDLVRSVFAYTAVVDESFSCITPIVGKAEGHAPNGSILLEYEYFGKRIQEPVKIVATDYTSFAILYFCAWNVPDLAVCAPDAVHVTVLARHGLDEASYLEIVAELRKLCVDRSTLLPQDNKDVDCSIEPQMTAFEGGEEIPELEKCFKPMDRGFCQTRILAFFYNSTSARCDPFEYTGCGGNTNNFLNESECIRSCQEPLEDIRKAKEADLADRFRCPNATCGLSCPPCCTMADDGCVSCNCAASQPRLAPATCVEMPSECPLECQALERSKNCYDCRCQMPDGSLQPAVEYKRMDPNFRCPAMCHVRTSPLGDSKCQCVSHEVCTLPLQQGSCGESIVRFFYNVTADRCDAFTYKGCTGNGNNFATHDECTTTCTDICRFPKDPGPCTDKPSERYFYNPQSQRCETMTYGGCGGNENNFESVTACQTKCQGTAAGASGTAPERSGNYVDKSLCRLPLAEGSCDAENQQKPELRFHYDAKKQECRQFKYAGCGGNENNFKSLHVCYVTCFRSAAPTVQPSRICDNVKCGCDVTKLDNKGCVVCDCDGRGGAAGGSGKLSAANGAVLAVLIALCRCLV